MNRITGLAATLNSRAGPFHLNASLFHSSPVLERKRRTHLDSGSSFKSSPKFNAYYKRLRKRSMLRDVGEFADQLFQSWKLNSDEYEQPRVRKPSWFRPGFTESSFRGDRLRSKASRNYQRRYEFCVDVEGEDDDFGTIFHSAFTGNPNFYWSFTADGDTRFRNSSNSHSHYSRFSRYDNDNDEDTSSDEYEKPSRDTTSVRRVLGLNTSGPLNMEDVKNAYRACALKWHPDRHQGSSKALAEEKFKACSAAYESLCQELAVNC